jgi:hypothetical protein
MEHSRLSSTAGILGSACALALALAPTSALATSSAPQTITVGTLTLQFRDPDFNGYRGSIKRAFDPTGLSGAVDCPAIQTGDPVDPKGLKACGQQLGKTAPLYGTKLAVTDASDSK